MRAQTVVSADEMEAGQRDHVQLEALQAILGMLSKAKVVSRRLERCVLSVILRIRCYDALCSGVSRGQWSE